MTRLGVDRRVLSLTAALLLGVVAVLGVGCTGQQTALGANPLREDIQELNVTIVDGRFENDNYPVQTRPVSMRVTTQGGPYTLGIDSLVQPQPLPANETTTIGFTAPEAGNFTMRLSGPGGEVTAILNVRPTGR